MSRLAEQASIRQKAYTERRRSGAYAPQWGSAAARGSGASAPQWGSAAARRSGAYAPQWGSAAARRSGAYAPQWGSAAAPPRPQPYSGNAMSLSECFSDQRGCLMKQKPE
jgi:hypothetical protein